MRKTLKALRDRRATLPWKELEAEAARQGCSAADIFFDRAGRMTEESAHATDDRGAPDPVDAQRR